MSWIFDPLERGTYKVIMADPAWRFKTFSDKGLGKSADMHYDTMSIDDIKALPVGDLAADDCWLWLWATAPMYDQARACIDAWGFTYSTQGVWVKTTIAGKPHFGTGHVLRNSHEPFIIARKGKPKVESHSIRSVIMAQRREHSRKPDEAYEYAEQLFGDGPRADLFARESRPGWQSWGNEASKFDKRCIKVCKLDDNGVCIGCDRTIEEITEAGKEAA